MFESNETLLAKAKQELNTGKYTAAEKKFKKLADKNIPEAYYWLGYMYESDGFKSRNISQAIKYYQFAANDGYVDAMVRVGDLCIDTASPNYNYQKAVLYFEMGAQHNNPYSIYRMGMFEANFDGTTHDYKKAISYFERIVNNEYIFLGECAYMLGDIYYQGLGVDQDISKALEYYKKAADCHYKDALYKVGECYRYDPINQDVTKATLCYYKAFKNGNYQAGLELAKYYIELNDIFMAKRIYKEMIAKDDSVEVKFRLAQISDKYEAIDYYQEVINELEYKESLSTYESDLYVLSLYNLAELYYDDESESVNVYTATINMDNSYSNDIHTDKEKAISLYEKAASLHYRKALEKLTELYQIGYYDDRYGFVSKKDDPMAIYEFKANQGDTDAMNELGFYYYTKQDYQKSMYWFEQSAKKDDAFAMFYLGLMNDYGYGVPTDMQVASEWYLKTIDQVEMTLADIGGDENLGILYANMGTNYRIGNGIQEDHDKAFKLLSMAEYYGNAYGTRQLANMYLLGQAVTQNIPKAFELLEKSAQAGNIDAVDDLGYYYLLGKYVQQDYQKAFYWFNKSAERNDAYGIFELAMMYDYGQATTKNTTMAHELYVKVLNMVEMNHVNIGGNSNLGILYSNMGIHYLDGDGTPQDLSKAVEFLSKSIEYGNAVGMNQLALMYLDGRGVTQNISKAFEFFEKSAHSGHVNAINNLGFYYRTGQYVQKDYQKALYWFNQSASRNDTYGMFQLGLMYSNGEAVSIDLNKANELFIKSVNNVELYNENIGNINMGILYSNLGTNYRVGNGIQQNFAKAFELLNKAVQYGNVFAMRQMAIMYHYGQHIAQNSVRAFELYTKSANGGSIDAMNDLGYFYKSGEFLQQDYQKALYWFNQSASRNDAYGMFQLGLMYDFGNGVQVDPVQCNQWYLKAFNLIETYHYTIGGNVNLGILYNNLGSNYRTGRGIQRNYQMAFELFTRSEKCDCMYAMYNLGMMYKNGEYVSQNYSIARVYFEKAANKGHQASATELRNLKR